MSWYNLLTVGSVDLIVLVPACAQACYDEKEDPFRGNAGCKTVLRAPTISLDSFDSEDDEELDTISLSSSPTRLSINTAIIRRKVLLPASPLVLPRLSADDDGGLPDMDCLHQEKDNGQDQFLQQVPQLKRRDLIHLHLGKQSDAQQKDHEESTALVKLEKSPMVRGLWNWIKEVSIVFACMFLATFSFIVLYLYCWKDLL